MLFLVVAIVFEVMATTALKETHGFTRPLPSLATASGYALAFYFLSLPLRSMPVGVVYAIWCGAGIVLITAIGWIWFRQALDLPGAGRHGLHLAGVRHHQPVFEDHGALRVWSFTLGAVLPERPVLVEIFADLARPPRRSRSR